MGEITQLRGFDFWSQGSSYRARFSVQDVLGMNRDIEAAGACHSSSSCTADQGGSQDGGGGDCNSTGDA